jgi:hypothetical protein
VSLFIAIGAAIDQKNIGFGSAYHKAFLTVEHEMVTINLRPIIPAVGIFGFKLSLYLNEWHLAALAAEKNISII